MNAVELRERLEQADVPPSDAAREVAVARTQGALREEGPRRRPSRRPVRVLALAALGATALIAFALLRGSDTTGPADSFGDFAALAAEQPPGLQYVRTVSELSYERPDSWAQGKRYPDRIKSSTAIRLWADPSTRYEDDVTRYWDGHRRRQHDRSLTNLDANLFCFDSGTRKEMHGCSAASILGGTSFETSLPVEPGELRKVLVAEIRALRQNKPPHEPPEPKCHLSDGFGSTVPMSLTAGYDRSTLLTDTRAAAGLRMTSWGSVYKPPMPEQLYTRLTYLLADPTSSPELRSAAFQVLASLKSARLILDARDGHDRGASVIQFDSPAPEDSTRFARDQLFVDPDTSQVLEQRTSVIETKGGDHVIGTYSRTFTDRHSVAELPPEADDLSAAMRRAERRCRPGA
jgi:hypothetical protein